MYLAAARSVATRVWGQVTFWLFRTPPKAKLEVQAVESWREATSSAAFYLPWVRRTDRDRACVFESQRFAAVPQATVGCVDLSRGRTGTYFQFSYAMEATDLPKFRRFSIDNAYGEGWAVYAEGLCNELGIYDNPYSDFGRLSLDAWRTARLVVDTGLHARRWSRARAIAYLKDNTLLSDRDLEYEVDRYISYPGQAVGYKIGQMKFYELRQRAAQALGSNSMCVTFTQLFWKRAASRWTSSSVRWTPISPVNAEL